MATSTIKRMGSAIESVGTGSKIVYTDHMAALHFSEANLTVNANAWNTIFMLPNRFRPKQAINTLAFNNLSSGPESLVFVKISTDGTVSAWPLQGTLTLFGLVTFVI